MPMEFIIRESLAEALRPPPVITVSEWSEKNMVLSADYSASTGRFNGGAVLDRNTTANVYTGRPCYVKPF